MKPITIEEFKCFCKAIDPQIRSSANGVRDMSLFDILIFERNKETPDNVIYRESRLESEYLNGSSSVPYVFEIDNPETTKEGRDYWLGLSKAWRGYLALKHYPILTSMYLYKDIFGIDGMLMEIICVKNSGFISGFRFLSGRAIPDSERIHNELAKYSHNKVDKADEMTMYLSLEQPYFLDILKAVRRRVLPNVTIRFDCDCNHSAIETFKYRLGLSSYRHNDSSYSKYCNTVTLNSNGYMFITASVKSKCNILVKDSNQIDDAIDKLSSKIVEINDSFNPALHYKFLRYVYALATNGQTIFYRRDLIDIPRTEEIAIRIASDFERCGNEVISKYIQKLKEEDDEKSKEEARAYATLIDVGRCSDAPAIHYTTGNSRCSSYTTTITGDEFVF